MNELALFAGAGGGVWASKLLGHRIVCYVEREPYCQRVIEQRIRDGVFDDAPIWDDVITFDGKPWRGVVDLVSAGFPCQPFSVAGARKREHDERNLWPDTIRVIREVRPPLAFLENVPGLLACSYWGTILGDLAESGFDVEWGVLSAAELGAWHRRKRLWILAHAVGAELRIEPRRPESKGTSALLARSNGGAGNVADTEGQRRREGGAESDGQSRGGIAGPMADADSRRLEVERQSPEESQGSCGRDTLGHDRARPDVADTHGRRCLGQVEDATVTGGDWPNDRVPQRGGWWEVEPGVVRVAHGLAHRRHRIRALGNGQVPIVAASAFRLLLGRIMSST